MKIIIQHDKMDCGPACLAMISSHYDKDVSLKFLRDECSLSREGVSILGISNAAEKIGFSTYALELTLIDLNNYIDYFPCILHWGNSHFVVLKNIKKNIYNKKKIYTIIDPGYGKIKFNEEKIKEYWENSNEKGIILLVIPNKDFDKVNVPKPSVIKFNYFINIFKNYRKNLGVLFTLLLIGNIINISLPFLTQNLIDKGVIPKNLDFIFLILISQFFIFSISIFIEIFRNFITLNLGTKLSISIISDFLYKLLSLPISFFETKMIGDLNQRIFDNERIEDFLTSQGLLTFFSFITSLIFLGILAYYNIIIFVVFFSLSIFSILWSIHWLKKRRNLDYIRFREKSLNQNSIIEIINSVSEMKLNNFEKFKLDEWEKIQLKLFNINKRTLRVDQFQSSGFEFINQIKNILISFLTAYLVVKNELSLGEMLAISFIVGQLNAPFSQFISFMRSFQFAKLSAERLEEVNTENREEIEGLKTISETDCNNIVFKDVSFSYDGDADVLNGISITIPEGKVTAVVGASGSGKTTLIKLLLKFYNPTKGKILFNSQDILQISPISLRSKIGTVMQDGFIFSETLERNIAMGEEIVDFEKLNASVKIANLNGFIEKSPLGFDTPLGSTGNDVSGGEKQRILIARAVYKNPQYIFLDEATSALDAENEKIIHDNLQNFFKGKTVIVVAHRLSTVKNADQIIVLNKGKVVEEGNHSYLTKKKGFYYNLVKNQLELGN
ncbi:peptidase domain-containing ABC transporter [Chishuiella sp.]|uniref:peptidase domain-containing ABC transporter n=1 Tax=Chishuiella sp. TaxID=1969467 RepID=UPI0028B17A5E|nr:peptidase domain-containing ABC transporter [Chishuiella sp.]